jgi:hypothetical protein
MGIKHQSASQYCLFQLPSFLEASSGIEGGQPTLSLTEDGCFDPYGLFMVGQLFSC